MFFVLSKVLYFLVMPLTIILACFILALLIKNKIYKKRLLLTGVIFLLLFTNDFIINEILLWWEVPPTPMEAVAPGYDVAIILTGVTSTEKLPLDRVYFQKGADRVMHTVQLYKENKIKNILITGGSGSLIRDEIKEADQIKKILLLCEIPEDDIMVENRSRNTYENAAYSAELLNQEYPNGKYLLVTSAFHLRRAQACFEKQGVNAQSFSTDFYTYPTRFTPDTLLIPTEGALAKWSILIKELVGMLFYRIAGYI
ncbi:YdcF family protein [soil metagenome]